MDRRSEFDKQFAKVNKQIDRSFRIGIAITLFWFLLFGAVVVTAIYLALKNWG